MTSYVLHKVLVIYVQRTQEITNDELCSPQGSSRLCTKNPGGY